jgi:hypothetical protein
MDLNDFPENSKVWVYAADRFFSEEETNWVNSEIQAFTKEWAAHGTVLQASGSVMHHNFIVFVVNEANAKASGCSIDSSVRFIKAIGAALRVDFFNRLKLVVEKNGELKRVHFSDLNEYLDWNVFNPIVHTLADLKDNWLIPKNGSQLVSA